MDLIPREKCFTCGACMSVCTQNAISFELYHGFRYPKVDRSMCINCGQCKRACPAESGGRKKEDDPVLFSFRHYDQTLVKHSSSGAAFSALSDLVIDTGGFVAGAILDKDLIVRHILTDNRTEKDRMRGAKYVQSDMTGLFKKIEVALKTKDIPVLFTGTPCQVDAFKCFCQAKNIDQKNVILCSLVCHGTASPEVWREYVNTLLREKPNRKVQVDFRNKEMGWRRNRFIANIDGKSQYMHSYSSLYFSSLCNRESCFSCPYTTPFRDCDITLGDFWSIDRFDKAFEDGNGVSMLLGHTDKGRQLIKKCDSYGLLKEIRYHPDTDFLQPALSKPYPKPIEYNLFWNDFEKHNFAYIERKYTSTDIIARVNRYVRKKLLKQSDRHVR